LFHSLAPESKGRLQAVGNGVNAEFFQPDATLPTPFAPDEQAVVFTGAMDYWPNIDAAQWFATDVLPALRQQHPRARFWVVGRNPSAAVQALAGEAVSVTGTAADGRPYLQHASAVVAPLRLARGIQNKILEAMAMGQPVVATRACGDTIGASAAQGLAQADDPASIVQALTPWLNDAASRRASGAQAR